MMLNKVDLPQPEGPMTARNSPGATSNDMWSTAVRTPSGVANVFDTSSTTSSGAAAAARAEGFGIGAAEAISRAAYSVLYPPPCGEGRPAQRSGGGRGGGG